MRIKDGVLCVGDKIRVMSTCKDYIVDDLGIFTPKKTSKKELHAGEVGYIIAGIKDIFAVPVGDTLTLSKDPVANALPGFKKTKPQIYAGLYPVSSDDFENFRQALAKLRLNDASLFYEPETSQALGFGFRCGFLGMLHLEIIQERLMREYDLNLIATAPTVIYEILMTDGSTLHIENPSDMPELSKIQEIREPLVRANILSPREYVGGLITLCMQRRGTQINLQYLGNQVSLTYDLPMNEVILNFFDRIKSISHGYASLDYSFNRFNASDLIKLNILINGEKVDALTNIVHRDKAYSCGRDVVEKMREIIPRQMFEVAIQAAIGGKIIARQTVKALRKNVTAKCYGGDITRKRKLLEKQKAGKKRMKKIGKIDVPQEAFLAILKTQD